MNLRKSLLLLGASLLLASFAAAAPAVVANAQNAESVDPAKLADLLVGKRKFWDNGSEVVIALLKDSPDADSALQTLTSMDGDRFKSHWQRLAFSGRGRMPKTFDDADALLAFVKSNAGAIGILGDSADLAAVRKLD